MKITSGSEVFWPLQYASTFFSSVILSNAFFLSGFCHLYHSLYPSVCNHFWSNPLERCKIFIGHTDLTDPTDFWSADKHDYFFIFTDHRTQASCRAQQSWHYSISHRSNGSHWFFCVNAALAASICEIKNNLWKENPWDLWDLCDIIITLCNFTIVR